MAESILVACRQFASEAKAPVGLASKPFTRLYTLMARHVLRKEDKYPPPKTVGRQFVTELAQALGLKDLHCPWTSVASPGSASASWAIAPNIVLYDASGRAAGGENLALTSSVFPHSQSTLAPRLGRQCISSKAAPLSNLPESNR